MLNILINFSAINNIHNPAKNSTFPEPVIGDNFIK
jgi:hypothetical protein